MTKKMYAIMATVLVAVMLGVMAVLVVTGPSNDLFANCRATKIASGKASIGGPFTLVNKLGQTVTDKDVLTKPSLVYFGYTSCTDICPVDSARNAAAVDLLANRGLDAVPVFISIDPEHDTPEVVGKFAERLSDKMIGLTGSLAQVRAASKAYKTYFHKNDVGSSGGDPFDHSTFTYLILPNYGFVELFRRDVSAKKMADSVACFINAS